MSVENSNGKPIKMHFLVTSARSKYLTSTALWERKSLTEKRYLVIGLFFRVRMNVLPAVTLVATVRVG